MVAHRGWVVLVACGQLACVGVSQSADAERQAVNRYHLLEIRGAVTRFQRAQGRLPVALQEVCPSMRGDESCPFWPVGQSLVDVWESPFLYELMDGEYELSSSGPDKRPHTVDDITFRPSQEREFVRSAAGCYRLEFSKWREFPGNTLVLDTNGRDPGHYQVSPTIPGYMTESWYPASRESVSVQWVAMHHSALLDLQRSGDSLVGTLSGGGGVASPGWGDPPKRERITATRTSCGTALTPN